MNQEVFPNYQPVSGQMVQTGLFNPQNALELSETRDVIEDFVLDLCGLQKHKGDNNKVTLKRFTKPVFTYEFAKHLANNIYFKINRITGRTTFAHDEIRQYNLTLMDSLIDWMSTEGISNLISDAAWFKIQERGGLMGKGGNRWKTEYNISWDYNSHVNKDMLDMVKIDEGLLDESFNQNVILREILHSVVVFVHGGINRSQEALTLNHEKVIYKEQMINNLDVNKRSKEGMLDGIKSFMKNVTGSGR